MDNITPPQISEERLRELKTQAFNSVMHGADRDADGLLADLVVAERDRQWLEMLEPVAWQVHGGRTFVDKPHSSRVGAELSAAERKDGATVSTLYRIKEQG